MARKQGFGYYTIGIYDVVRSGREWVARGRDFGFEKRFPTLAAAHLELTGESIRDDFPIVGHGYPRTCPHGNLEQFPGDCDLCKGIA